MTMIMLVLLSVIAVSATYSTTSSLRIVGNMQMKDEALTAAQAGVDDQLAALANFTTPADRTVDIDINQDGVADYSVTMSAPQCLGSVPKPGYSATVAGSAPNATYWDVTAVVIDARTGAHVTLNQGVRIDLLPYQGCP
jgi:hypothetical protein